MAKLPPIDPHTAAKHLLLRRYLDRWFPILGRGNDRINYIDGFAGPGEYESGHAGSPLIAIEAARQHLDCGTLSPHVQITFAFIEARPESAKHLEARLTRESIPPNVRYVVVTGKFEDQLRSMLDSLEADGRRLAPTFAFVDPFGFSGVPFDLMQRILRFPKCEVFVNVMVEFINRFLEHPNDKVVAHFPKTFGTDEVLDIPTKSGNRVEMLLKLYERQLKTCASYVDRFDMHGRRDQKTYSLFFATNNARGFEKMKEAMWSLDQISGSRFSDASPEEFQFTLFGFEPLWEHLHQRFSGTTVPMSAIERFVIEQTRYLPKHARDVLRKHEEQGDVVVHPVAGSTRRKGTFPVDKVVVEFR